MKYNSMPFISTVSKVQTHQLKTTKETNPFKTQHRMKQASTICFLLLLVLCLVLEFYFIKRVDFIVYYIKCKRRQIE